MNNHVRKSIDQGGKSLHQDSDCGQDQRWQMGIMIESALLVQIFYFLVTQLSYLNWKSIFPT